MEFLLILAAWCGLMIFFGLIAICLIRHCNKKTKSRKGYMLPLAFSACLLTANDEEKSEEGEGSEAEPENILCEKGYW